MDSFLGLSDTAWTAIYTIITGFLLITAVLTVIYAKKLWESRQGQAEDARKAQVEASRPYIVVKIEPSGVSPHLFDLTVRNIGWRPAFDVSISFDPPPIRASETDGHELSKAKMLNEPVAMIAPGQEMRTFYDSHLERKNRKDLPTSHEVSFTYKDSSGQNYSQTSTLDIDALKGTVSTSVRTPHDIGKAIEKISKTLNNASVLRKSGSVRVQAADESRAELKQRLAQQQVEDEQEYQRLRRKLGYLSSAQAQGTSDASPQSKENEEPGT